MDIFIMNLPQDKDRLASQKEQMARLGLSYEVIESFSPKTAPPEDFQKLKRLWRWDRDPIDREIAILLTYMKAWKKVVDNQRPALILEDDLVIKDDLPAVLQEIEQKKEEFDFIYVEKSEEKLLISKKSTALAKGRKMLKVHALEGPTGAYILFPRAAEILLSKTNEFTLPGDDFLFYPYIKIKRYIIEPYLAEHNFSWAKPYTIPKKLTRYNSTLLNLCVSAIRKTGYSLSKRRFNFTHFFVSEHRFMQKPHKNML